MISIYTIVSVSRAIGHKMRALYQRRKGRDLFDIWFAITQGNVNPNTIIEAWNFYMKEEGNSVTQKEFLENVEKKMLDQDFLGDMEGSLRPVYLIRLPKHTNL